LSSGNFWQNAGPVHESPVVLPWAKPTISDEKTLGEVIHFDRFGNAITNIHLDNLSSIKMLEHARVTIGRRRVPLVTTYTDVSSGNPLAYFGSGGMLEIAIRDGSAQVAYDLQLGESVSVYADTEDE